VYLSRPPFDHSKIPGGGRELVAGRLGQLGTPGACGLNFEYDVECYSTQLAARLEALLDEKISEWPAGAPGVGLRRMRRGSGPVRTVGAASESAGARESVRARLDLVDQLETR